MNEIRKIRDENSQRHLNMTPEELTKEFNKSVEWFTKALGKDIAIITSPNM
jgi:hypothetical protein